MVRSSRNSNRKKKKPHTLIKTKPNIPPGGGKNVIDARPKIPSYPDLTFMLWNIRHFSIKKQQKQIKIYFKDTYLLNEIIKTIKTSPVPDVVNILEVVANSAKGDSGTGVVGIQQLVETLKPASQYITPPTGRERYGFIGLGHWNFKEGTLQNCETAGKFKRTAAKVKISHGTKNCNLVSFHAPAPKDMADYIKSNPGPNELPGILNNPLQLVSEKVNELDKEIPLIFAGDFNLKVIDDPLQRRFLQSLRRYIPGLEFIDHGRKTSLKSKATDQDGNFILPKPGENLLTYTRRFRSHAYDQIFFRKLEKYSVSVRSVIKNLISNFDIPPQTIAEQKGLSSDILQAVLKISDHLPVVAQFRFHRPKPNFVFDGESLRVKKPNL